MSDYPKVMERLAKALEKTAEAKKLLEFSLPAAVAGVRNPDGHTASSQLQSAREGLAAAASYLSAAFSTCQRGEIASWRQAGAQPDLFEPEDEIDAEEADAEAEEEDEELPEEEQQGAAPPDEYEFRAFTHEEDGQVYCVMFGLWYEEQYDPESGHQPDIAFTAPVGVYGPVEDPDELTVDALQNLGYDEEMAGFYLENEAKFRPYPVQEVEEIAGSGEA